ncbi:M48 family metalloprotease [Gardnerella sp. DNF00502]|uniref:M48 family metalloprotease n=1 Tax=unclassified Gardnerella TaxID=2628112 RepID=UPI000C9FDD07|nr:M48 family metalloprotease [Gardnerella sp. KA00735]PNP89760.1 hypothetical protein BFS08_02115 [Gardnerella sp. KA00735]
MDDYNYGSYNSDRASSNPQNANNQYNYQDNSYNYQNQQGSQQNYYDQSQYYANDPNNSYANNQSDYQSYNQQNGYSQANYSQVNYQNNPNPAQQYQQPQTQQSSQSFSFMQSNAYSYMNTVQTKEQLASKVFIFSYLTSLASLVIVSILFLILPIMVFSTVVTYFSHIRIDLIYALCFIAIILAPAARYYYIWKNPIKSIIEILPYEYASPIVNGPVFDVVNDLSARVGIASPAIYSTCITANAFSMRDDSGSAIFISEDLINNCTVDEIRAIIAHEFAHLTSNDCIARSRIVAALSRLAYYRTKGLNIAESYCHGSATLNLVVKRTAIESENMLGTLIKYQLADIVLFIVLCLITLANPLIGVMMWLIGALLEALTISAILTYFANACFYRLIRLTNVYHYILKYVKTNTTYQDEYDADAYAVNCVQDPFVLACAMYKSLKSMNTYASEQFSVLLTDTYAEPLLLIGFNPYYIQSRIDINRFNTLCEMYPGLSSQFPPLRYLDQEEILEQ